MTFLRPAPYGQNLAPYLAVALTERQLRMPYSVDRATAMVELADVGRAAATVLGPDFEQGSGWDLCGVGAVTHREIAERLGALADVPIEPVAVAAGVDTPSEVRLMFDYMDTHGLAGSTGQLRALIGEPTPLDTTLGRLVETARVEAA